VTFTGLIVETDVETLSVANLVNGMEIDHSPDISESHSFLNAG